MPNGCGGGTIAPRGDARTAGRSSAAADGTDSDPCSLPAAKFWERECDIGLG